MNKEEGLEKAELIKWWDALRVVLSGAAAEEPIEEGLQLARECQHPDAQWLASLFPSTGQITTRAEMVRVLEAHGEDPRASYIFAGLTAVPGDVEPMRRVAEMGYAPAQARYAADMDGNEQYVWSRKAALQNDRLGLFLLGKCFAMGVGGCVQDVGASIVLFHEAARCGHMEAQELVGEAVYRESDWQRYHWWHQAALRGSYDGTRGLLEAAEPQLKLLPQSAAKCV
jgi:hypothetical protein